MKLKALRIQGQSIIYDAIIKSGMFEDSFKDFFNDMQNDIAKKLEVPAWNDIHTKYYTNKDKKSNST